MTDEFSEPRTRVTRYEVLPTGFDQAPFVDKHHFVIYVEQYQDTGRWRVWDGFRYGLILTKNGTWTRDRPQVRHLTRFDTAQEAIAVALEHTDDRPGHRDLPEAIRRWRQSHEADEGGVRAAEGRGA